MANSKMTTTVSSETSETLSLSNQCDNVIENTNSTENEDNVMKNTNSTDNEDYIIGDIVWAKIGRYPYWPSIVCIDPVSNTFMKGSPKDKKFSLHVRFYNDNGRRSWAKTIEKYNGKEEILKKYPNCLSFMKNNRKQIDAWHLSVRDADKWVKVDRNERMSQFCIANDIKTLTPILNMESSPTTRVKKKAKAKEIQYEISEKLAFVLRPVKGENKKKKKGPKKRVATSIDHVVLANNSHSFECEYEPPTVPFDPRRSVPTDMKARISLLEMNTEKLKPSPSKPLGIKTKKMKPSTSSKSLGIKTKKMKPSSSSSKPLGIKTKKMKPSSSSSKLLEIKTEKLKPSSSPSKLLEIKTEKLKPSSSPSKLLEIKTKKLKPSSPTKLLEIKTEKLKPSSSPAKLLEIKTKKLKLSSPTKPLEFKTEKLKPSSSPSKPLGIKTKKMKPSCSSSK